MRNRSGIVFGGSSGIGRACAEALAADGVAVVVADVDEGAGASAAHDIEAAGGRAAFVACDITDEVQVKAVVAEAVARFGGLDVVVTSAGASTSGPDAWHRAIDLFLKGPYYASLHALPQLERAGGGVLIHVGSIASIRGSLMGGVDRTGYPSAKHGIIGLTKTLALGYGSKGIRVNAVCPGYIKTALTKQLHERDDSDAFVKDELRVPLGRWGEPSDVGGLVRFLASDEASYISGQAIVVDGGMTAR